jgi:hypothetical protein
MKTALDPYDTIRLHAMGVKAGPDLWPLRKTGGGRLPEVPQSQQEYVNGLEVQWASAFDEMAYKCQTAERLCEAQRSLNIDLVQRLNCRDMRTFWNGAAFMLALLIGLGVGICAVIWG